MTNEKTRQSTLLGTWSLPFTPSVRKKIWRWPMHFCLEKDLAVAWEKIWQWPANAILRFSSPPRVPCVVFLVFHRLWRAIVVQQEGLHECNARNNKFASQTAWH